MDGTSFGLAPAWTMSQSTPCAASEDRLMARVAYSPEVMQQAWSLRYECYSHHGFLAPNADRIFKDEYDLLETSKTIVIYKSGVPVASVRVCLHDPVAEAGGTRTMPVMESFADVIPDIADGVVIPNQQKRVVEVLRLVSLPSLEKNIEIIFALFRMAKYLTKYFESDILFCAVRNNHVGIYRRIGFHKVAEPRHYYSKLSFQTALMMGVERDYEKVQEKIPFLRRVSKNDQTYQRLIAGDLVPVFGDAHDTLESQAQQASHALREAA